jgi:sugar-specific transcriptional regulator TrmB
MNIKILFERLGLAKHAHTVYRTLRSHGPMLASGIIGSAGLHRPAAYDAIRDLLKHRFILMKKKGKRNYYEVTNPKLIAEEFAKASNQASSEISKLSVRREKHFDEQVRFLEGPNGIREAFDDVISHTPRGETFYRYTSEKDLASVNRYLSKGYRVRRDAKKVERLVISNPLSGKQKRPRLERFIKFMPSEFSIFDHNIIEIIYGSRLLFIDLNSEKVVIIENKTLAEFQKVIFRQMYRALP